ncbi:MAG TPA: KH domain-containing protein [Firmicutes bacterium]|nr:KH domain-containing protein [Bacillota bacterium]
MTDLVTILVKALVDNPDQVQVNQIEGEQSAVYEVKVAPDDVGKVIGKQGRVIRAIRTVVKAAAAKSGKRVQVEVIS